MVIVMMVKLWAILIINNYCCTVSTYILVTSLLYAELIQQLFTLINLLINKLSARNRNNIIQGNIVRS